MVVSDTDPVPPLFLGRSRSAVPDVVAIIGSGTSLPVADEEPAVGTTGIVPVASPAPRTDPPQASPPPAPPDAGGDEAPRKRRRF